MNDALGWIAWIIDKVEDFIDRVDDWDDTLMYKRCASGKCRSCKRYGQYNRHPQGLAGLDGRV